MTNRSPPSKSDRILIVGAGVFGLSTALELKSRGYQTVTVLDRYLPPVPDGSSVDISRVIRTDYADPLYARMGQEALDGWKTEYKHCYHPSGFVMLSETSANPYIEKSLEISRRNGRALDEYADGNDLKGIYPDLQGNLRGIRAYHNAEGGWADAELSIRHLSRQCSQAGVSFVTGVRGTIRSLRRTESRIVGVNVASQEFVPASHVILSMGAWSNLLLDFSHAASASGQPLGFIQLTQDEARSLKRMPVMINLSSGVFCFPPTPDTNVLKIARHGYGFATNMLTGDGSNRIVSSPKRDRNNAIRSFLPDDAEKALRQGLRQLLPRFADYPWSSCRLCWYTDTSKGDFIIDHHPTLSGLFLATGGAGHAFKFLPVLGRYTADCFENRAPMNIRQKWRLRPPEGSHGVKVGDGSRAGPPLRTLTDNEQAKI